MTNRFLSVQRDVIDAFDIHDKSVALAKLKLLVVEDVQEDVELIELALDTADVDCEILVASSLSDCERHLREHVIDAVLADYRLPDIHAPEILRFVRKQQATIPFILVTGSLGEEAAVECIKTGMTDYVLKDRLYRLGSVLRRALAEADLKQQQQHAIAKIEQLAWHETILNRVVQVIRETLILEEVLQATVNQLQDALGGDRYLVVQSSSTERGLVCRSSADHADLREDSCRLCCQLEPTLKTGCSISVMRAEDTLVPELFKLLRAHKLHAALVTPLVYQKEYFGALALYQTQAQSQLTEAETDLVQAVAEQCAIAIYQANLYKQAQCELEQRRRVEEQLRYDAFHDSLTGLPNRALFLDRLNHALQIARRDRVEVPESVLGRFAVLFLDLDDFRIVNDSLGHGAGDFLLEVVANRLSRCLRVGDTLARTSGDEFALLLEDIQSIDDIIGVVESIQEALKQPIMLEAQEIFVSTCVGIVIDAPNYSDAAQFLRDADTAMYQAKAKGRGSYQVFNLSMHTEVKHRLQIENDLRRALDRQEFHLVYQPIIHLPTQQCCGFEALLRWHDPMRDISLSPTEFIPIAERTGLIVPIGKWVLHEACSQWERWMNRWPQHLSRFSISVNLSAKQFAQQDLTEHIEQTLLATGVDFHHLRIEITESALIENEKISLEILRQLQAKDIQIAMDDFGTGYSSLSYLLRFPKDVLKIDKSFVSKLQDDSDNEAIIKTILALGSNLKLDVVAEGIETALQAEFLVNQGCEFGQGYWFSAPLLSAEAESLLAAQFEAFG